MENIFKVDYTNREEVCQLARDMCKKHGGEHVVFKHPDRPNYNITHKSRFDTTYPKEWAVFVASR